MDLIRRLVLVGVALGSVSKLPFSEDGRRGEEVGVSFPVEGRARLAGEGPPFSRAGGAAGVLALDGRPTPERHKR